MPDCASALARSLPSLQTNIVTSTTRSIKVPKHRETVLNHFIRQYHFLIMFSISKAVLFATLLATTSLATSPRKKTCTDYEIPVTPTSLNLVWGKKFVTDFDVVDFISDINSRTAATSFNPYDTTTAPVLTTASYTISATFCTPQKGATGIVLLLSRGLNFDRR